MPVRLLAALCLLSLPASALKQPNGATIPNPPGCNGGKPDGLLATFACACTKPGVCNIGAPCSSPGSCDSGMNGTCESTMWHEFNDNTCIPSKSSGLDPIAEAATTPETFRPTCPLTFTIVTRGTAKFKDAFGWYNVTGAAPAASDLHEMLAGSTVSGDKAVLDLRGNPAYKGGDIGFFLVTPEAKGATGTCAGGNCVASVGRAMAGEGYVYYSERKYNPDQKGVDSFIHLLVYNSHVTQRKFFFAWEDIFGGSNGDFTDLVTSVEGVECSGGGKACSTSKPGVCSYGVEHCKNGALACVQVYAGGPEVCDGLDNDCDGTIDNGAKCDNDLVCWNGECVPHCAGAAEFSCAVDTECDAASGLCLDPLCKGKACPTGQICRKGACVGGCDGVTCPHGQTCRLGNCIDACKAVTCPSGQVCSEGLCVPGCGQCDGLACAAPLKCDAASGACVDPSCATACATGTYCDKGACKDACEGAVCPAGQTCEKGDCRLPYVAPPDAAFIPSGDGAIHPSDDLRRASSDGGKQRSSVGCDCRVGREPASPTTGAFALLLLLCAALRRLAARRPD